MDNAIALTKQNMRKRAARKIARSVEERIVRSLCGDGSSEQTMVRSQYEILKIDSFLTFDLIASEKLGTNVGVDYGAYPECLAVLVMSLSWVSWVRSRVCARCWKKRKPTT